MSTSTLERRMKEVENAVANMETRASYGAWVDAKKRLPKEEGRYIIYAKAVKKNGITIAYYYPEMGWWLVASSNIKGITHWMPLPKPPKRE